ncbi:PASTA domain-containing protein [Prosthecochloris sp. HL-130-GSB]|jgi:eukaryotic-like serine/threonine-protein kinase|nr:PASTA domain-containing protein [Prosthecochloris sp. HL-130-GSB]ARM30873.1 penicillin-binding protein [Prosthecochloris sp. HL-130-GSB]
MKKTAIVAGLIVVLVLTGILFTDRFIMPSYTRHNQSVVVPDVEKMKYDEAVRALRASGLDGRKTFNLRYVPDVDSVTVIVQRPAAGSKVKPGRRVALVLNKREKPEFPLPDFYGRPLDEVRRSLSDSGISVKSVQEQAVTDPAEDGKVLGQSLPPSTVVRYGSSLSLIVGKLEEQVRVVEVSVPNVQGLLLDDARQEILEAGFNTGNVLYEYSELLVPNTVINQKPAPNSLAEPGQVVELTIVIRPD